MSSSPRVLLAGAYERDNFGDLLFLLVTERYLDGAEVVAAAPFSADMRALLDRHVPAYGPLLRDEAFDAIWTVGGQVGRVDLPRAYRMSASPQVWPEFEAAPEAEQVAILQRATGGEPPLSPYIPLPAAYPRNAGAVTVLNSVGIAGARGREAIVAALRGATAISVRDGSSSALLTELGIGHRLLPDAVHALGRRYPADRNDRTDAAIVQISSARLRMLGHARVGRAIARSPQLRGRPVRLLLAGTATGHDAVEDYERVARAARGVDIAIVPDRRPLALVEHIRRARVVVGTSLHVRIVAAAYGVPRVSLSKPKPTHYAQLWDSDMPFDVALGGAAHPVARPQPSVSVIVPVYNPGHHIDDCIESLLAQSMPAGALELIFVDDGSTDGTPARLDALAAEHPHVKVVHIPNSGWPGRPRNIGIEMARGEFVYFVDNDDWVERDGIERMHAAALRDGADIVIGKVVGHDRRVPRKLFRESLHAAPFDSGKFLGLLTPHKLFRRAMLIEHGIRFPEGRLRLEDHRFVVHAYFHAAGGISVLADRPVYHWVLRDIARHASSRRLDPDGYYGNVREVLDIVVEHTEPGAWRDRLMTHWYRGKMLGRVGGRVFTRREDAFNRELMGTIRSLALERFDEDVHARLAFNLRARSLLLRAGDYEGLLRLAELESALRARVRARVRGDGRRLTLSLRAALRGLEFARDGERLTWLPPAPLRAALPGLDATEAVYDSHMQVLLHSLRDGTEYTLPAQTTVVLADGVRPVLSTAVDIQAATAAAGRRLPDGDWELRVIVTVAGFNHARSVRRNGAPLVLTAASGRLSDYPVPRRGSRSESRTLGRPCCTRIARTSSTTTSARTGCWRRRRTGPRERSRRSRATTRRSRATGRGRSSRASTAQGRGRRSSATSPACASPASRSPGRTGRSRRTMSMA